MLNVLASREYKNSHLKVQKLSSTEQVPIARITHVLSANFLVQ